MMVFIIFTPGSFLADDLNFINWLLGTWKEDTNTYIITESWQAVSPHTLEGTNQTFSKNKNTITQTESLRVIEMYGEVFYLAKVAHNHLPVAFKLIISTDSLVVFENQNHDFPKKIAYRLLDARHLRVDVSNDEKEFRLTLEKVSE